MAKSVISVEPASSLVDEKVRILVNELVAKQTVTLEAKIVGDKGEVFESHALYIADKDGKVDVCRDASLGGSYSGVEPMGLLWSMKPALGQRKSLRLLKRDVTKPYNVVLNCFDGHITPCKTSLQPLSSTTFQKWYMADGVKRIVLNEQRFRGTLFIPPGKGPFPGVIDLLGGAAVGKEYKASLLASHGFVTLALDYSTLADETGNVPNVFELEYFEEVVDWLSNHPKVLPGGIGLHAICFGSWIALLLASFRSDVIKATVAVSPLSFAFISFKYRGKLSEIFPIDESKQVTTESGLVVRSGFASITEDNGSDSKFSAITPCENISCPVLLIYGTDDLNVNVDFCVKQVYERMKENGKGELCSVLCYPGAGHLIEPPYSPHCYSSYSLNNTIVWAWGGETVLHAHAQGDAWPKIIAFLKRNIPQTKCNL